MQKNAASKTGLLPNPKDDLGLDFANTLYWRGKGAGTETLNTWTDLLAWCKAAPATTPAMLAAVGAEVAAGRLDQQAALQSALSVREATYRLMTSAADGQPVAGADLAELNRALAGAPVRAQMVRAQTSCAWKLVWDTPGVAGLLTGALWSAADLLCGPRLARVRRCANEQCRWLFLDDSKSGNRRWCSMSACGNRAKAHRHYLRSKGAPAQATHGGAGD